MTCYGRTSNNFVRDPTSPGTTSTTTNLEKRFAVTKKVFCCWRLKIFGPVRVKGSLDALYVKGSLVSKTVRSRVKGGLRTSQGVKGASKIFARCKIFYKNMDKRLCSNTKTWTKDTRCCMDRRHFSHPRATPFRTGLELPLQPRHPVPGKIHNSSLGISYFG